MSSNLVFVLLLMCAARINAISDEMKQMGQAIHNACVKETGVEENLIEDCRKGTFPEDPNLKCYMKCLLTKIMPLMNEEGDIDVDTIVDMVPEEYKDDAEKVLRSCGTVKGADNCETAFLTNKCWYSKRPEHYYLV